MMRWNCESLSLIVSRNGSWFNLITGICSLLMGSGKIINKHRNPYSWQTSKRHNVNPLTTVWRFSFHIERRTRIFLFWTLLLSVKAIPLLQDSHLSSWQSHTQTEPSSYLEKGDPPPILVLIHCSLETKFSLSWKVSPPKFYAKERW